MRLDRDNLALYLAFCIAVHTLARTHRVSVKSWWRTPAHNAAAGGIAGSRHLDGIGADVVPDPDENRADVIRDARDLGLQVVDEGDHLHLELDPT